MEGGNQAEVEEISTPDSIDKMEPDETAEISEEPESPDDQIKDRPESDAPRVEDTSEVDDTSTEGQRSEEAETKPIEEETPSEKKETSAKTETKTDDAKQEVTEQNTPKEPDPKQVPSVVNGGGDRARDLNEPFHPWYKTLITDAIKNGENIFFTVETTRLDESSKYFKVERIYEDFEWLHHCLTTDNNIGGIVIPPVPIKPVASAADAAAKSRKELGEESRTLKGDEFEKDIQRLEKYLGTVIKHSVFGRDIILAKFLTEVSPPIRAKLKKSIFNNFTKVVEGVIKGGHQDVDESFQKHRLNAANMVPLAKDMTNNFQGMINHSERLSGALNHFSTALCLVSSANANKSTAQMNEMQLTFARSMEHLSHAVDVFTTNDERTLGFTLDLYSKYAESVKEMLGRRTVKLYEFNSAVKNYEKAKPLKKQAAEEVKNQREKEFNDISETAKQELSQYQKQRILDFQQALIIYAEAQIKTARDAYALLAKDLSSIKTMELDGS